MRIHPIGHAMSNRLSTALAMMLAIGCWFGLVYAIMALLGSGLLVAGGGEPVTLQTPQPSAANEHASRQLRVPPLDDPRVWRVRVVAPQDTWSGLPAWQIPGPNYDRWDFQHLHSPPFGD